MKAVLTLVAVRRRRRRLLALSILMTCGCAEAYQVAEVDGVLLIGGKPASRVRIEFFPDTGNAGPPSMAETDADGKFTLTLKERDRAISRPGASVGVHRIVLCDLRLAESATGRGIPVRIGPNYTLAGSTPLTQTVIEGKQTIEIRLP